MPRWTRVPGVLAGALTALLLGATAAFAHVTVYSPDTVSKGGDAEIVLRAPNESDTASLVKVRLDMPLGTPLSNASPAQVPGWTSQVTMTTLKQPVKMDKSTVTQAVQSITWTAQQHQGTPPNGFQAFSFWSEGLPTNTTKLTFSAVQTYSDGTTTTWNQPESSGAAEPEHPAPTLDYTTAPGSDPRPATASMKTGSSDDTARWLAAAGLTAGVVGVGAAILRRPPRPRSE